MNDRFDDDLRRAAAPLAQEPVPNGVFDSRLDEGAPRAGWPRLVAALAGSAVVAVAALIGLGQLGPDTGQPSPSPSVEASLPTDGGASAACEEEPAPEPGVDEVLTYFMCEPPPAEPRALIREGSGTSEPAEELRTAIEALLAGPTTAERERGYTSVFPPNSEDLLAGVEWQKDGLVIIDFDLAVTEGLALNTSHNRFVLFRTLEETAFQFDAVTAIEYRLEGSCADFATYFETMCDHTVKSDALTSVLDCPIVPPAELPSGAATTVPRVNVPAPFSQVSWGSGTDTVTQRVADLDGEPTQPSGHEPVSIRGEPAFVTQIDDLPGSSIQIAWMEGECAYINWVSGITFDEAIDFARRFDGE